MGKALHGSLVALRAGSVAAAVCAAVTWAVLALLTGGTEGLVGGFLSGSANGVTTTAAAATGGPVDWWAPALHSGGRIWPVQFLLQGSPLALLVLGPLLGGLAAGWLTAGARSPGTYRRGTRLLAAAAVYAAIVTLAATVTAALAPGTLATVSTPPAVAFGLGLAWCAGAGLLGQVARAVRLPRQVKALAGFAVLLLIAQLTVPGSAVAAPRPGSGSGKPAEPMTMAAAGAPEEPPADYYRPGVSAALAAVGARTDRLKPTGDMSVNLARDPWLGVPTQVSVDSPVGKDVKSWLRANAGLFAVKDPVAQLRALPARLKDRLGGRHDWFQQEIGGVPVYGARVGVHRDVKGRTVQALTNGLIPDLAVPATVPTLAPEAATAAAARVLPGAELVEPPALYVLPDDPHPGKSVPATLTWRVWLATADGRSTAYFVDALSTGRIVKFEPTRLEIRERHVWDLKNNPETDDDPARNEGQGPASVADVNDIYDHSGMFYDYMLSTFGLDSFDGQGAAMNAGARYSSKVNGPPERNAFFMPNEEQTAFGEGMGTLTVVAHEWQHGVTYRSASLFPLFQGGALHESFSDVFAAMVEQRVTGSTAWKAGVGTPLGIIRDLANPHAVSDPWGPHPAHYSEYRLGCIDSGWVHANSLIPSHAWYILATRIGMRKTAEIAYRDLTVYLGPSSRFTDTRVGAIQAAYDLYGKTSPEGQEVWRAFGAVGIDGTYESPRQRCMCFADESLTGVGLEAMDPDGSSTDATVAALLRTRELFENAESGAAMHYAQLYARTNSRAMDLLVADDGLRGKTAHLMQSMEPAFHTVGTPAGDRVIITQNLIDEINGLVDAYIQADADTPGGGTMGAILRDDRSAVDGQALVGMTANQVLAHLDSIFN
ncbi:Zn-dependent metalloprotease [Streptosporangium album]|uniref:Zn-dependent metalloprotease n=1 Tax=Streptosporangium album TaxID=47479 RepID=A0A7W7RPM0_9ACTN|nr:M4 family metallopeptidase [Streptosporangium album]MBB4935853.1 Zn-dependent metalloprotease [Streptosporangium album]